MAEAATLDYSGISERRESHHKSIRKEIYTNALNYANFTDAPVQAVFQHKIFDRSLRINAVPAPCNENSIELKWVQPENDELLEQFQCSAILIPEHDGYISVIPEDWSFTAGGILVGLPESAELINCRRNVRHSADSIDATLIQGGSVYTGNLIDFNPEALLVNLDGNENPELRWINREDIFNIILKKDHDTIFAGSCSLLASRESARNSSHTFRLTDSRIMKFRKKKFRGDRFELNSPVVISFRHPLSGERCRIPLIDISAAGLSVCEDELHSVLIPGMMLSRAEIILPGGTPLECSAQVIYREKIEEAGKLLIKCGLAVLDMDPVHHSLLLNFIHQENDSHTSVCPQVDMNALWKFFFESGFIYPEKYRKLSANKTEIKDLYERLYTRTPGIARHFIYEDGGRILGHMSMLRSYEESWLMHHHAASAFAGRNAGLQVLGQAGSFANNSYRLKSLHMLYLMCYYREENRFPKRVFGDIAKNTNNPAEVSEDRLSYFHFIKDQYRAESLPENWTISPASSGDLRNLESCYRQVSDGMMLKAMSLSGGRNGNEEILNDYRKSGFDRQIELTSLNYRGECRAIIMTDKSETGINMSNLTDSLKVFVIDSNDLTTDIIYGFIRRASGVFTGEDSIPVLMFPDTAADKLGIPVEKNYTLWILNTEASDSYFRHLKTLLKRITC